METRTGYYTEKVRNEAYIKIVEDDKYLNHKCKIILMALLHRNGSAIMQELSDDTGIPVHLVSARMSELVELEAVGVKIIGKDLVSGKDKIEKRENPASGISCTVWHVKEDAFNRLGGIGFGKKKERKVA